MNRQILRPRGRSLTAAIALALALPMTPALAQGVDAPPANWREILEQQDQRIRALEQKLQQQSVAAPAAPAAAAVAEEQDQRIKVLERKLELAAEDAATKAKAAPVIKAGPTGFSLASADGKSVFKLRGVLHADHRYFFNDAPAEGSETFLLRRVRPTFEGTIAGVVDFRFTPDFASGRTVIQDAYAVVRVNPALAVTVGKFKAPFGLERLQSSTDIRFIERSLANNFVPNRDIGIQVGGELLSGALSYAFAVQNGVIDGGSSENNATADVDNNDDKDFTARVFAQPFKNSDSFALRGLGLGVAVGYVDNVGAGDATGSLLTTYRTPGQQTLFRYRAAPAATVANPTPAASGTFADGERFRFSPQGYYYNGPLGVLAEYTQVSQEVSRTTANGTTSDKLKHDAWHVQAGWFLTGEDNGFKSPAPKTPWGAGGFGAIEIVARFSQIDFDDASFIGGSASFADPSSSVTKARAFGLGVNWYLTQNLKVAVNYETTKFDGGAANGGDKGSEGLLFSRLQVGF